MRVEGFLADIFTTKFVYGAVLVLSVLPMVHAKQNQVIENQAIDGPRIIGLLEQHFGVRAQKRGTAWVELLKSDLALSEREILEEVNQFFNGLQFVDDINLWGMTDYWATPVEFIGANGGDCEEFSIAKYFTLREMGISDEKMRITMVKAISLNQYHMVLAYYETPSSVPLILDNLMGAVKPATQRSDLAPIFSFNGTQLWLNKERGQDVRSGNSSRIEQWNDLRRRINTAIPKQPKLRLE